MIKVNEISLIFTGGHQQLEVCLTLMAHREHLSVFLRAVFWRESVSQNPPPLEEIPATPPQPGIRPHCVT